MVTIHREALGHKSRCRCDDTPTDMKEHCSEKEHRSDDKTNEHRGENYNTYAVDRIV